LNEQKSTESLKSEDLIHWLNTLAYPRPFSWQRYVYWRRAVYGLVTTLMLVGFVGVPFYNGLVQSHGMEPNTKLLTYWTTIILGAFIVGAFARVSLNSSRLFDDCKWLAQSGAVGEASLLWVLGSDKSVTITYVFYDIHGRERQREACITTENGQPLPKLSSGDLIPVLFDPHKSDKRNMLWIEVSRYVHLVERKERATRKRNAS